VTLASSKWSVLWLSWIVAILMVGILPLSNFVGHSHWEYIKWVPTAEQLREPAIVLDLALDVVGNVLLFVPFGFFYAGRMQGRLASLVTPMTLALLLSCGIELYQVYCHNRNTSLVDIFDNVLGAYVGLRMGKRYFEEEQAAHPTPIASIPNR
jgi:glycopeptide antibiotics resistance protein